MSARLAEFIYRWRLALSALIIAGAILAIPRVNITHIDNDITAWFSREDPVYKDYERFRREFGGTRSLIIALKAESADRIFSRETLGFLDRISSDIERVDTVQRVASLATATLVRATPDGGLDVRPLLEDLERTDPADIKARALGDDLIRGDLVSDDATVTALIVSFDEDRIDSVRGGVIQTIHDIVDPRLPPGVKAYYNGSLEISETYNRVTLDNQQKFTPPILLFTLGAIFVTFRSWRKTLLSIVAITVSILWTLGLYSLMGFSYNVLSSMIVPLIVVLAIADDVHIMQHWDEERRRGDNEHAFKATVAHLTAPLLGASATTAPPRCPWTSRPPVYARSIGRRYLMMGSTSLASSSFGNHPVGMKSAVSRPHAMNAPTFGMTMAVRNPPKAWTRALLLDFCATLVSICELIIEILLDQFFRRRSAAG